MVLCPNCSPTQIKQPNRGCCLRDIKDCWVDAGVTATGSEIENALLIRVKSSTLDQMQTSIVKIVKNSFSRVSTSLSLDLLCVDITIV